MPAAWLLPDVASTTKNLLVSSRSAKKGWPSLHAGDRSLLQAEKNYSVRAFLPGMRRVRRPSLGGLTPMDPFWDRFVYRVALGLGEECFRPGFPIAAEVLRTAFESRVELIPQLNEL